MRFDTPEGPRDIAIRRAIVAGWTGRDRAAVDHHIAELAEIGVTPPSEVPLFYRVSAGLLTQAGEIQVLGPDTSGEVEPLVIHAEGQLWLGLASDHTDRALEAVSVAASKQICAKPVASMLWPFADLADHLDRLTLTCEIVEDGTPSRYQEGTLASILPLPDLIDRAGLKDGDAMLCGTLAAIGGVRPAGSYRMALHDPVEDRALHLSYTVATLPEIA
ncbi:DUF2848 domain-containing protein [Ovoidimarina sediminis]|uniref:DUF2848 domain-containing protein n=1 Tax=Ovoidimarina sediminis TaxID=3079856 RepID=UPI002905FC2C|nr:DUF2848 domain-containing protein [Rhodophyticola sp. MJ-SS7]MDU8944023.1 DUF2848 domain-containing protein [Rhodophyticola sp. MJ-SS7]